MSKLENYGTPDFTLEQCETIVSLMIAEEKWTGLRCFYDTWFPNHIQPSDIIRKSRVLLFMAECNWDAAIREIESAPFNEDMHPEMERLLRKCQYSKEEAEKKRPLGAVDKYRLRKKKPLPRTIWDGSKSKYGFKVGYCNRDERRK